VELPASGLLGVLLDTESEGEGIGVQGFMENSGAQAAGMEEGDRIVKIGEEPINAYADVRIALIGSRPGQKLPVEVLRDSLIGDPERLVFEVELH
jgi:S1-C subfamily serine protease